MCFAASRSAAPHDGHRNDVLLSLSLPSSLPFPSACLVHFNRRRRSAAILCLAHKNCTSKSLSLKVNSTSFTSAQLLITKTQAADDVDAEVGGDDDDFPSDPSSSASSRVRAFEVHYRALGSASLATSSPSSASAALAAPSATGAAVSLPVSPLDASLTLASSPAISSEANEWQVKTVSLVFPFNSNQSLFTLDDLLCGCSYLVFVVELETGERTESVNLKTQRKGRTAWLPLYFRCSRCSLHSCSWTLLSPLIPVL